MIERSRRERLALVDNANRISRNEAFEWVLMRYLHRVTVADLMQVTSSIVQQKNMPYPKLDGAGEHLVGTMRAHASRLGQNLAVPLANLIADEATSPGDAADG